MRISTIEIGTNSTKFILAELSDDGSFKVINKICIINRLSNGMYLENFLSTSAIEKEIEVLGDLINESERQGAKLLSVFSTSVLRDAGNKQIFLDRVKRIYDVDIDVISGDYEARLAYMACKEIVKDKEKRFAVIDIGGGSTEITIGNGEGIENKVSLNLGAVRLTEMFVKHDPISNIEIDKIILHIDSMINEIETLNISGLQLVGTGGTIKSLGTIFLQEPYSNESKINGEVLNWYDIELILDMLVRQSVDSKNNIVGLNPKRSDVITTGVIILLTIMRKFNIKEIKISTQGVLEGYISEHILTHAE